MGLFSNIYSPLQTGSTSTMEDKTNSIFLSVIIPAYNEEERLPDTLEKIEDYLQKQSYCSEIIVVDDGSSDNTVRVAKETARLSTTKVVSNPCNLGKGGTIKNGMLNHARGRYRLFTDADNSTPIEETEKLLKKLTQDQFGVAIGSRAVYGSKLEVRQPFYRELMGRTFNLFVQILLLPGILDTQCGFKMFTAKAADYVFKRQKLKGFSFDVEILYLAHQRGFGIAEVPIRWIDSPASRVSPIKDSVKVFWDVFRLWLRRGNMRSGKRKK